MKIYHILTVLVCLAFPAASFCKLDQDKLTPITLKIIERKISVNRKQATVYGIVQPDGTAGLTAKKRESFNVLLENTLDVPSSVHWHGLILPNNQDGVAFITQFPIYPGTAYQYQFPLVQAGTYWMHGHYGLQEQKLLSAPLIIYGPEDEKIADQEVVVLLADFSFKSPTLIFEELRCPKKKMAMAMPAMQSMAQDIVDVDYDAFLANGSTLDDPEVVEVKPGKKIRLRIIDGASATNFFLSLGNLDGEAIAVDGN